MEGIVHAVTEHPLVAMAVCFVLLLIVYFLFKSLIKMALIMIMIAAAIGGYLYFQHPETRPANLKDAVEKARTGAVKAVDQGKDAYEKGRVAVDKGKEAYVKGKEWVDQGKTVLHQGVAKGKVAVEQGKTALNKGIAKGKAAVEKAKDAAGGIGKFLGGNPEDGDGQKP
jgi:hypothetical protein